MLPKNPELAPLAVLIGTWKVTMKHVAIPQPLSWQDSFSWLENAFIIWHWQGKNEVPQGILLISRNGNKPKNIYSLSYYDSRGIARIFEMNFHNGIWKFWREDPDFFQRFAGRISDDGTSITGAGEISHDKGKTWNHDYDIIYTKVK